jgi:hypothetical protein
MYSGRPELRGKKHQRSQVGYATIIRDALPPYTTYSCTDKYLQRGTRRIAVLTPSTLIPFVEPRA